MEVECSIVERNAIEARAKSVNLSISEYHIAANINQTVYKRNRNDELNAIERAKLMLDATVVWTIRFS